MTKHTITPLTIRVMLWHFDQIMPYPDKGPEVEAEIKWAIGQHMLKQEQAPLIPSVTPKGERYLDRLLRVKP